MPTPLTHRFTQAVDYARIAHANQVRKGSDIPYIYHLLGVASLVIAYGGNEDQAIAGLLHDVLEDCGAAHEQVIRAQFGDLVADIVKDCTDGTAEEKSKPLDSEAKRLDWLSRKLAYLKHVRKESDAALLVSACDKLHNASAIVDDLENPDVGGDVFGRFTATREQTLAYYHFFFLRSMAPSFFLDGTCSHIHRIFSSPTSACSVQCSTEKWMSRYSRKRSSGLFQTTMLTFTLFSMNFIFNAGLRELRLLICFVCCFSASVSTSRNIATSSASSHRALRCQLTERKGCGTVR